LDPAIACVSPKAIGWMKTFFVVVLMTCPSLIVYYNCFVAPGEVPSPNFGSFSFSTLDDSLVVGFLGGIVPTIKIDLEILCKEKNWIGNIQFVVM
jgi:hypothetical protein